MPNMIRYFYNSLGTITHSITCDNETAQLQLNGDTVGYITPDQPIIGNVFRDYKIVNNEFVSKTIQNGLLNDYLKDKKNEITTMANFLHIQPIQYDNKLLDADEIAQQNIYGKITELKNNIDLNITSTNLFWKDANNLMHTWNTPSEYLVWLQGLFNAITTRRTNLYALSWQGKAEVESMSTIEQIQQYDVEALFQSIA